MVLKRLAESEAIGDAVQAAAWRQGTQILTTCSTQWVKRAIGEWEIELGEMWED